MAAPLIWFDLKSLPPGEMSAPEFVGSSIESGRSQSGINSSIDVSGGGYVAMKYSSLQIGNIKNANMKYYQQLRSQLAGSVRSIITPLMVDFMSPIAPGAALATYGNFAIGSTFANGGLIGKSPVAAYVQGAYPVGAAILSIKVFAPVAITGGEWFDLFHPVKMFRSYNITDVLSVSVPDSNNFITYSVAIRSPLRDTIGNQSVANFIRPRCMMKLDHGTTMPLVIRPYWYSTPEISLVEDISASIKDF